MIHYSHLSHWLRTPTAIRQAVNPYDWIAELSQVLVQERWCRTGESICNGDIASTIMQGIDLSLFKEPSLNAVIAVLDKYAEAPGSLSDEAKRQVIRYCAGLQQGSNHSPALMAEEGQPMKVSVLNSSGVLNSSSPAQHHRITEVSTTTGTTNRSAYPRPSTPTASCLIASSNRSTPLAYHGRVSAAEPPPVVDTASGSVGFSCAPVHQPILFGAWPVPHRFRRNRAALPAIPERSLPVSEGPKETPNWLRQTAQLVAQMSCQSITSEQVITALDSVVGCRLTEAGDRQTPVAPDTRFQVDDSPLLISRR
ncbi:hypothetical protein [unidentified bacterial endosymbiont]|uniref:hypothetical protein n=1 Tax=unidentified bacterial endosymbiont TaxID=2355 RepID=UPI00209D2366|nr:hypothetical protein [unidentified bacterial endosymbiont]